MPVDAKNISLGVKKMEDSLVGKIDENRRGEGKEDKKVKKIKKRKEDGKTNHRRT